MKTSHVVIVVALVAGVALAIWVATRSSTSTTDSAAGETGNDNTRSAAESVRAIGSSATELGAALAGLAS